MKTEITLSPEELGRIVAERFLRFPEVGHEHKCSVKVQSDSFRNITDITVIISEDPKPKAKG